MLEILILSLVGTHLLVFQENLAQVMEKRKLEFKKGVQVLKIERIPSSLITKSFNIEAKGLSLLGARKILPTNPLDILKNSLGKEIVYLKKEGEERYTLSHFDENYIYLINRAGEIKIIERGEISKVLFPSPKQIIKKPYIEAKVKSNKTGKIEVLLNYLTGGFSWSASYDVILGDKSLEIRGGALIKNGTDIAFKDATISLYAGRLGRPPTIEKAVTMRAPEAGAEAQKMGGEFYRFDLKGKWDIPAEGEVKTSFANITIGDIKKRYVIRPFFYGGKTKARIEVKTKNKADFPLPPGEMNQFVLDKGTPKLVHRGYMSFTPVMGEILLDFGESHEIEAVSRKKEYIKLGKNRWRETDEVVITNGKKEKVKVDVEVRIPGRTWEIKESNFPHEKKDINTVVFHVEVKGKGKSTLLYTYEASY